MKLTIRPASPNDAETLGHICFDAFGTISRKHNFPTDFSVPEAAVGLLTMLTSHPEVYGIVAELDGRVVGSNFLWEGNAVSGVGPITVDPGVQDSSIGRKLMEDVIRRSDEKGFPAVRLVQAAYHNRSLSLYTKLGFNAVEPLSVMQGPRIDAVVEGRSVRPMTDADVTAANELCFRIHGHTRRGDISFGLGSGSATVVEAAGRLTGYSTTVGFFGHSIGESNEDLKALIAAAPEFAGTGFLLPTRNSELMRWCFENGLRIIQPLTLMSRGIYQEPRGRFLPSILY
jgi:predicted N-acetyltransferase YhbS